MNEKNIFFFISFSTTTPSRTCTMEDTRWCNSGRCAIWERFAWPFRILASRSHSAPKGWVPPVANTCRRHPRAKISTALVKRDHAGFDLSFVSRPTRVCKASSTSGAIHPDVPPRRPETVWKDDVSPVRCRLSPISDTLATTCSIWTWRSPTGLDRRRLTPGCPCPCPCPCICICPTPSGRGGEKGWSDRSDRSDRLVV